MRLSQVSVRVQNPDGLVVGDVSAMCDMLPLHPFQPILRQTYHGPDPRLLLPLTGHDRHRGIKQRAASFAGQQIYQRPS